MLSGLRTRLSLLTLFGVSAPVAGFWLIPPFVALSLVEHAGYFAIALTTAWFAFALFQGFRDLPRSRVWPDSDHSYLAVALAVTVLCHAHSTHEFKVLWDEPTLSATAMSMHFDREVYVPLRAHELDGVFTVLGGIVDKRPVFFPFLLSLIHDATGYRPENVFVLNAIVSFLVLIALARVARRIGGHHHAGTLAMLLLGGLPLFVANTTGGGFELLNVLMILVVIGLGWRMVDDPRPATLDAFVLATVLLAQTRYESVLFVPAAALIILFEWWRSRRVLISWGVVASPLLLLPVPMLQRIFTVNSHFWQLREGDTGPFGLDYLYKNLGGAVEFLFSMDGRQLGSPLLATTGIVSLVFTSVYLARRWRKLGTDGTIWVFAAVATVIVANFVLLLCYHWGQLQDFMASRLALPLLILLVLATAFVFGRWIKRPIGWTVTCGVAALWLLLICIPITSRAEAWNVIPPVREFHLQEDLLQREAGQHDLFVFPSPLGAIVHRRPALSVAVLSHRAKQMAFHLARGTYREVWIFQRIALDPVSEAERPDEHSTLGPEFILEPVFEEKLLPLVLVRISRLVAVDLTRCVESTDNPASPPPPFSIKVNNDDGSPTSSYLRKLWSELP